MLPDISIRQLEYLVAVDEHSTWAAAAESVGVSASALSQGLAELERRVGVPLFEPVGRRRVLRASSAPVLAHARQVVSLTSDLTRWAQRINGSAVGRVRLGMIDVAAVVHFPEVVRSFRHDHPDVDLTLTVAPSRQLLADLAGGDLDAVVCVMPDTTIPGVETVDLLSEPLVVYGPPGIDAAGLADESEWGPWLLFPAGSHTRDAVEARLRRRGPITVAAESHQPDVLREMVLLGLGWTVLPRSQGFESEGPELLTRTLVLARRVGAVTDPAVDALVDGLRPVET